MITEILESRPAIADYQRQVQPLIEGGVQVYLRAANLADLHITYDYPRIKLADGQIVADTSRGLTPSGGADILLERASRELKETGRHRVAFRDHYTKSGKLVVDEWLTIHADKVMPFPAVKAIFLLNGFGRILEEMDERAGRRALLEQQVAEDAAADAMDDEPPAEVEEAPAEPTPTKPAFLQGKKGKNKSE